MTYLILAGITQFTEYNLPLPFEIPFTPIWLFVALFIIAVVALMYQRNDNNSGKR